MDTVLKCAMFVHKEDGTVMKFKEHKSGLYYYNIQPHGYSFAQTVAENKLMFTKAEVDQADKARELYCMIGYLSEKDFKRNLSKNQLANCPIGVADAK